MLENIQSVIFDLDGTLVDSMWLWHDIDVEFLEKRGLTLPETYRSEERRVGKECHSVWI